MKYILIFMLSLFVACGGGETGTSGGGSDNNGNTSGGNNDDAPCEKASTNEELPPALPVC